MDIAIVFEWFAQESVFAAELNSPPQLGAATRKEL